MDLNLSKISKFLVVVILMLGPVTGSAQEVGGYAVKSKEHAAQVEEFAKCVGYFRVAKDNAFELQLEFDEEEFSDEAIQTFFDNVRSFGKISIAAEVDLPQKHRAYLQQKRDDGPDFGWGFANVIPTMMLVQFLRGCTSKLERILEHS